VARHLNFRAAGDEISLTQSAVSRQIQGLEDEVGTALFLRHTRAVELTSAGTLLLRGSGATVERIDAAVRQIRQSVGRKSVAVTTWASFDSMWLIPRLEAFQREHPDIDIRIDASDVPLDLTTVDVDLALRYAAPELMPPHAVRLFGEQLTPVVSPWLLKDRPLRRVEDMAEQTLIEAWDAHRTRHLEWLTWQRWLDSFAPLPRPAQASSARNRAAVPKRGAQALAVLQLFPPDCADGTDRPGRGAGPEAPGGAKPRQRGFGGAAAAHPARFTPGLLAAARAARPGAARSQSFLRLAAA